MITTPSKNNFLITFEEKIKEFKGLGPGFNTMRFALAFAILIVHCVPLAHGFSFYDFKEAIGYPLFLALLPMFFALSGFLVTGSAVRLKSTYHFFINRALRIIPALFVEVLLSAIILGSITSALPIADYFKSTGTYVYFGNIIGLISFELPGVFEKNPFPRTVNGNLWTLLPEYYCYLFAMAFMILGVFYRKFIYLFFLTITTIAIFIIDYKYHIGYPFYALSTSVLVFSFFVGSLFFQNSSKIIFSPFLCVFSFLIYIYLIKIPGLSFLSIIPLAYVTVFLGFCRLPSLRLFTYGDYSYGIYLYGFPIQQTLVNYFPSLHTWWILAFPAVGLTMLFSIVSWHCIEKPILSLKSKFY